MSIDGDDPDLLAAHEHTELEPLDMMIAMSDKVILDQIQAKNLDIHVAPADIDLESADVPHDLYIFTTVTMSLCMFCILVLRCDH